MDSNTLSMKESRLNQLFKYTKPSTPKARLPIKRIRYRDNTFTTILQDSDTKDSMHRSVRHSYNGSDASDKTKSHNTTTEEDDHDEHNDIVPSDESSEDDSIPLSLSPIYMQNSNMTRSASIAKNAPFASTPRMNRRRNNEFSRAGNSVYISSIIFIVIVILACYTVGNILEEFREIDDKQLEKDAIDKAKELDQILDSSIKNIQRKFYNQKSDIWNDIASRMYDVVLYPNKPSIITLFGNETDTMNCLAQLLGQLSGIMLGSNDYLIFTPEDMGSDLGEVIHNLKMRITQKRAVVFQDLLNINTQAIKAFHNLCDRENPLVGHAIYIITVVVEGYKPPQKELAFIEKQISEKLSGKIEKDILDPLITRITDGAIISVQHEPRTNSCTFPFY